MEKVIHACISTRLDYCNALYVGVSLLTGAHRHEHVTPILSCLHWLPVHDRINFKVLTLVYKCLNGLAPPYLSELLQLYIPSRTLRSADQLL